MYDVIIIGCGVSGAACAWALAKYDLKIGILEASNDVANGTTKANSAIIHAGYDPEPGSLLAKLNVRGNEMAEELCEKLDVPFKKCGSFVLAFSEKDMEHLKVLYDRGVANGVKGLEILTKEQTLAMEPNLSEEIHGALWAPTGGIINPWEYALAMAETAVRNGAEVKLCTRVEGLKKIDGGYEIATNKGTFTSRYVINAAGVDADKIHAMLETPDFEIVPTRGQYYLLDKCEGCRVNHVIFQCPSEKGKGILVSPTVHGNLIVGPDAEVVEPHDVSTTSESLTAIAEAAKRSVPGVNLRQNIRNFAGVRANTKVHEFIIGEPENFPGFIDVAGIRSPGLSAAPAIGEYVAELVGKTTELKAKENVVETRTRLRFHEMSPEQRNEMIAKDPAYGRMICRCESVTEGEIVAALRSPIPPVSINAVKRRVGAGMGRCQGGFCSPKVHELINRELGIDYLDVCLDEPGSEILVAETKVAKEANA